MKYALSFFVFLLLVAFYNPQTATNNLQRSKPKQAIDNKLFQNDLFGSEEILDLTLRGDTRALFNDRSDNAPYQQMKIVYVDENDRTILTPLKVKTRGNFRRDKANCFYPPLLLNFSPKKTPENTLFSNQDKLKLVTPCRDQKYIVHEYLVYKLYNLITPNSFRARLVRVVYTDTNKGKDTDPLYGIILEDEDQMAERNHSEIVKRLYVRPQKTNREFFLKMAVFEYLIANTDWSVQYRHNVKLLHEDSSISLFTVPYDFDHAGIVRSPYAKPPEALKMRSVQERRYRGYCIEDMAEFDPIFALFNALKDDIYRVYTDCNLLDDRYVKNTTKFLDDFYKTINNPKASAKAFSYPCDKTGTGNVVIKGLRE